MYMKAEQLSSNNYFALVVGMGECSRGIINIGQDYGAFSIDICYKTTENVHCSSGVRGSQEI